MESIAIDQNLAHEKSNYKVLYNQQLGKLRTDDTDEALEYLDCSELVCRFLQCIGWSEKVKNLNTSGLYDYAEAHPKWLKKHDSKEYKPKVGDVFLWKNNAGSNGHTGVVIDYDATKDIVTTIEALRSNETPYGSNKKIYFQGTTKIKWSRTSRHLLSHRTKTDKYTAKPCRFYTPKIHFLTEKK